MHVCILHLCMHACPETVADGLACVSHGSQTCLDAAQGAGNPAPSFSHGTGHGARKRFCLRLDTQQLAVRVDHAASHMSDK